MLQSKFHKTAIFYFLSLIFFVSCADPTMIVRDEKKGFKLRFPDQVRSLNSNRGPVGYAWSGDFLSRPVVFVHGSPGSWEGWAHLLLNSELQKNFHLIAIDRPGYGASYAGKSEPSLENQAAAVLEALKLNRSGKPAVLVGHSYGGPVIAKAAMMNPEVIGGLVFVAASLSPELETTKWIQYPASWWPFSVLIPSYLRICNEEILGLRSELEALKPYWPAIKAKIVSIQGSKDDLVPPGNQDFLVSHVKQETLLSVVREPSLNHYVPWKRPDLITDAIRLMKKSLE